ncbi:uncharcterized protein [Sporisorium scitamineum]|uniref:Uncharcterized protein n=1 Tax=Sporisorium scitamineum TaxID=49012 RepID=A0A127Z5D1_9BASI|nr:uncharcterized protein [Sporisorium scitamineum]
MRIKCFFFAILAAALAFTLVDAGSLESTFELWRPGEDTTIFTSRLGRLLEGGRMQPSGYPTTLSLRSMSLDGVLLTTLQLSPSQLLLMSTENLFTLERRAKLPESSMSI